MLECVRVCVGEVHCDLDQCDEDVVDDDVARVCVVGRKHHAGIEGRHKPKHPVIAAATRVGVRVGVRARARVRVAAAATATASRVAAIAVLAHQPEGSHTK